MRYFTYVVPINELGDPKYTTMSEDEIRKEYWPQWYQKMCEKFGQAHVDEQYCFEDCLQDWITVNWAWEGKE